MFGVELRSEAIFCTSNIKDAEYYGDPYYIFPIGKYEIY
jgi:hypothetical protein